MLVSFLLYSAVFLFPRDHHSPGYSDSEREPHSCGSSQPKPNHVTSVPLKMLLQLRLRIHQDAPTWEHLHPFIPGPLQGLCDSLSTSFLFYRPNQPLHSAQASSWLTCLCLPQRMTKHVRQTQCLTTKSFNVIIASSLFEINKQRPLSWIIHFSWTLWSAFYCCPPRL